MEKYFENINFKRIYFLIVWIMFGLFGAFFIMFSVNGKTKFIFFALVTLIFNTVIFLYYHMAVPVFKTNDRLYTDKEFCYI